MAGQKIKQNQKVRILFRGCQFIVGAKDMQDQGYPVRQAWELITSSNFSGVCTSVKSSLLVTDHEYVNIQLDLV